MDGAMGEISEELCVKYKFIVGPKTHDDIGSFLHWITEYVQYSQETCVLKLQMSA